MPRTPEEQMARTPEEQMARTPEEQMARTSEDQMAKTSKEQAEACFQEAVAENVEQNLDEVIKSYEKAITLDPDHLGADHNLHILKIVKLQKEAKQHVSLALLHENHKSVPNPHEAIKRYKFAKVTYQKLIEALNEELTYIHDVMILFPHAKLARYEKILAYNKQLSDKRMKSLENMVNRNKLYIAGLKFEAKIGSNRQPDYEGAIKEYKKAIALNHVPAKIMQDYLLSRNEKTEKATKQCDRAIALGNTNAMFDRAHIYEEGWGKMRVRQSDKAVLNGAPRYKEVWVKSNIPPELDKAINLYKRAYDHGNKRAKDKIDKLAGKLHNAAEKVVKMVCIARSAYDVKSDTDSIRRLRDALETLCHLYKRGWGNDKVAESKKAEDLGSAIRCLDFILTRNSMNHIKSAHLHERDKENNPNLDPYEPAQKKQKTTQSPLTTGGMFSTVPALASATKIATSGEYPITANSNTTFSTPSILGGRSRPSMLKSGSRGSISRGMSV